MADRDVSGQPVCQLQHHLGPKVEPTPSEEDATGDRWTLGPDGSWTDHRGETRDRRYTPILAPMGPWTPVD